MPARRLDEAGLPALKAALSDPVVLARYRGEDHHGAGERVPVVDRRGLGPQWARAHGRRRTRAVLVRPGRVMSAHRFAFAVMHGVEALDQARLLGHRCHNPLCHRIAPDHVVVSSARQNRQEWATHFNDLDTAIDALQRWEGLSRKVRASLNSGDDASKLERSAGSAFEVIQTGPAELRRLIKQGEPVELAHWIPEVSARFQNVDEACLAAARSRNL